jgi:hypothetical protein
MTKQVTIDYMTLRTSTSQVLQFTKDYVQEQNIDLKTSLGEDLSLWELDGYVFLDKFQEKFRFTLPDKAYDYVCTPNSKLSFIQKVLFVPIYILIIPFFFLAYPFLTIERKEGVRKKIRRNKHRLTLGDLAASLAVGEFVKREDLKIELKQ